MQVGSSGCHSVEGGPTTLSPALRQPVCEDVSLGRWREDLLLTERKAAYHLSSGARSPAAPVTSSLWAGRCHRHPRGASSSASARPPARPPAVSSELS